MQLSSVDPDPENSSSSMIFKCLGHIFVCSAWKSLKSCLSFLLQQKQNRVEFSCSLWHKAAIAELLKFNWSPSSFGFTGDTKRKLLFQTHIIWGFYFVFLLNLQASRRETLSVACKMHNIPKIKIPILRSLLSGNRKTHKKLFIKLQIRIVTFT